MPSTNKHPGFTIVELLIVIVVIAILATISVIAYNGIQQRARNSQMTSAAKAYQKGLILYATTHGTYPNTGTHSACLGSSSCYDNQSMGNATFNSQLSTIMDALPTPPQTQLVYGSGGTRWGAAYLYVPGITLDGQSHPWWLWYILEGNQEKCQLDNLATMLTYPSFSSAPPTSGFTESAPNHACWIWLPNPAKL